MENARNIQKRYLNPDPDPKSDPKGDDKRLTEAEVNAIVQKRVAETQQKALKDQQVLLERIKTLEPEAEEKQKLQQRIEEIEKQGLSEKEIVARESKKERERLQAEKKAAEDLAAKWKTTYEKEKLEGDLMAAAADPKSDVFNPVQVVTILRNGARLSEKLVDGKSSGQFETRVKYNTLKDNQVVELDLTPAEAVKMMADEPIHGNLFKSKVSGGLGAAAPSTKSGAGGKMGLSQEEFNKRYAKGTLPKNTR